MFVGSTAPNRSRLAVFALAAASFAAAAALTHVEASSHCTGVAPVTATGLKAVVLADNLDRPLLAISPPGDVDRVFIVEQDGRILLHRRGDPSATHSTFLDITDRVGIESNGNEMGLLGLAFDPDFATTGELYVNYTETDNVFGGRYTVVSRFDLLTGNPDQGDPASEARLVRFQQPERNHNGGMLEFGDDGFLYIYTGDGGGAGDGHGTCGNGQDTTNPLGKILRIDVRGVDPAPASPTCADDFLIQDYDVPSDNPFVTGGGPGDCHEIFAYGLRNPWRGAFDPDNGDLYVADVGQSSWEEINYVNAADLGGQNFGWRLLEGTNPYNQSMMCGTADCTTHDCPVLEYSHAEGCSITGGYVYRGCLMSNEQGNYFYGDYCDGFVRSMRVDRATGTVVPGSERDLTAQLDPANELNIGLTSFGVNGRGELLILDRSSTTVAGRLLKILPLFTDLVVSGPGAGMAFELGNAAWGWQDLEFDVEHDVASYRVYRGVPNGTFSCVYSTTQTAWIGGDLATPGAGSMFAYLVTAVSPAGDETSPGEPAAARTLSTASCP
jgi:glucose/arabinose dehydrogenase